MDRMKTFLIYLILFVALYFFVDFASFAYIKTTYNDLTKFVIDVPNPKIKIQEAKATYINGYIKGTLLNNTEEEIEKQYLKFEFFSERDVLLGRKFIKVENLSPNATRDFEIQFNFENVDSYKITLSDESEIQNISDAELLSDPKTKGFLLLTTLIFLYI